MSARSFASLLLLLWSPSALAARPIYTLPGVDYPAPMVIPSGTPPRGITAPSGDPAAEVTQDLDQYSQTINSLNQLNPASDQFGKLMGGGTPMLGDSGEQLQKLLTSSSAQKWIAVISDPELRESAETLAHSPRRMTVFYSEIGLFLILLIFRAWRFSKVTKWYRRLWVSAYSLGLYWLGSSFLIPWLVLGAEYRQFVSGLIRILRR